jgi:hypothetical protein
LANGAPVGGAVGVALAAGADLCAAAGTGAAGALVDSAVLAARIDCLEHQVVGCLGDVAQLLGGDLGYSLPRVEVGGEAGLALEDVADAGDQVLVEQGVAEAAFGDAGQRLGDLLGLEVGRQDRSVYKRAGRPCPRCGTKISSRGQGDANRTTYWCPSCQPSR